MSFNALQNYLYLDLEVDNVDHLYRIGFAFQDQEIDTKVLTIAQENLEVLYQQGIPLCGHNIRRFDYPYLTRSFPHLKPWIVIDTLELSVLAFPLARSHRLDKAYKSSEYAINNPLDDALETRTLLAKILEILSSKPPELIRLYGYLLSCGTDQASEAYRHFFTTGFHLEINEIPDLETLPSTAIEGLDTAYLKTYLNQADQQDFNQRLCLAAIIAWHSESDLSETKPPLGTWISQFRDCPSVLNQLKPLPFPLEFTYQPYLESFGLKTFRGQQEEAIQSILADQNPLILMATGSGKSLCYQLPALMISERQKGLTIVISPLQALMADQVSDLLEKGLDFATFINGNLTPAERSERLEQLRNGEKDLLYISAEQLRSPSIRALLNDRLPAFIVFDEAHCISQWGHEFRPDYRYAPKFIGQLYEKHQRSLPCMAFMTATATLAVRQDIQTLFATHQIVIQAEICTSPKRENLIYKVIQTTKQGKESILLTEVKTALTLGGAIIIYSLTRKNAEHLTSLLMAHDIKARFYHSKIAKEDKQEILHQFKRKELNVIVATSAFGMGIDRPDVRAVIHYTMSHNLEAYVQEAGRAGRDGQPATCTLLFDPQDSDTVFFLQSLGQLSDLEIRNLFRSIRELRDFIYGREKISEKYFWVTINEIFRFSDLNQEFASTDEQKDIKIKLALHYLECFGMIEREENQSVFISFNLIYRSPEESLQAFNCYAHLHYLPEYRKILFHKLISAMHLAKAYSDNENQPYPLERLSDASGLDIQELKKYIKELEQAKICTAEIPVTILITKGVKGDAKRTYQKYLQQEQQICKALAQYLDDRQEVQINCRALATHLDPDRQDNITAMMILDILEGWTFLGWIKYQKVRSDVIKITEFKVIEYCDNYHYFISIIIDLLYSTLEEKRGARLRLRQDLSTLLADINHKVNPLRWELENLEKALSWMHRHKLLRLADGSNLFYQSMKVRVIKGVQDSKIRREYQKQVKPHYEDQTRRTHVMLKYGAQHQQANFDAQQYIIEYFSLSKVDFLDQYLSMDRDAVKRPVTQEDYDRIITPLNPLQREIVLSESPSLVVIAGPGSGKTRTIVHRIAYLVKVKRVDPDRIIVLAYNRNAVRELRIRLQALVGEQSTRLRVYTFHGLSLAILGRTVEPTRNQTSSVHQDPQTKFSQLIQAACDFLEHQEETETEEDQVLRRSRLLENCEYIFVDEYQDVAEQEYRLVKLIAGLQSVAEESQTVSETLQTQICVIGDDDQNIYEWRGTSPQYIRSFQAEYQAKSFLLIENYRSTEPIIAAANRLIQQNCDRLKQRGDQQVRINNDRINQGGLAVQSLTFENDNDQAEYIKAQVEKWIQQQHVKPREIAILARNWQDLDKTRALLERRDNIPTYSLKGETVKLIRNHITRLLLSYLEQTPNLILAADESVTHYFEHFFQAQHRSDSEPTVQKLMTIAADLDQERGYGSETLSTEIAISEVITSIYEFSETPDRSLDPNGVLVTSCHGAKGLEFKNVILIADRFDDRADRIEAERRLFYVAMTRAQEKLILTQSHPSRPSRFVQEAGAIPYPVDKIPIHPPQFVFYADLTPEDIHLGFAGSRDRQHLIQSLKEGDSLALIATQDRQNWTIRSQNQVIGLLSKKAVAQLKKRQIYPGHFTFYPEEVAVRNIYQQVETDAVTGAMLAAWYVPIPQIRICR